MQNTHRDFGPLKDGVQERYLSYYGIKRAIREWSHAGSSLLP